uniref:Eukaryotic translation initiation factor 3 subunit H n=1 Tax=Taeniopygia guttata TaxID=59729 RepID=A0A674GWQ6_TAEGU
MATSCTRGGLGWTSGRISSQKGRLNTGMGCPGSAVGMDGSAAETPGRGTAGDTGRLGTAWTPPSWRFYKVMTLCGGLAAGRLSRLSVPDELARGQCQCQCQGPGPGSAAAPGRWGRAGPGPEPALPPCRAPCRVPAFPPGPVWPRTAAAARALPAGAFPFPAAGSHGVAQGRLGRCRRRLRLRQGQRQGRRRGRLGRQASADRRAVQYQMEMMRSLRHVNIDHLHVGWYQSTYYGSFVTRALLDSQFSYQHAIEESVVLIYDPIKTAQGSLSLKAYRLTPKLMEVCKEKDFSPEALKKANIAYENMFEEVPIVIKNSYLINVMLWELEKKSAVADRHELLSLASSNHLGKSLQLLMDRVDEMSQDIVKYNTYLRNVSKQQQQKHQYQQRRQQENIQRQSRGEPPLPEEDINKLFKPPQPPPRMESLLIAGQINTYCQNIKEFNAQNLGKLFMAQALQDYNN